MKPDILPSYADSVQPIWVQQPRKRRLAKLVVLLTLIFCAYQVYTVGKNTEPRRSLLSVERLHQDYKTCAELRRVPKDPSGPRERNARFVNGTNAVLIKNAIVWTGEPVKGASEEDIRTGKGWAWIRADIYLEDGLIKEIGRYISEKTLADDHEIFDAKGRKLTAGLVDMHSHAGVDPQPSLQHDENELSSDITPYVRSIDGLNPLDQQIQWIKSGGVTTSLILPGSGNNIGGEAFVIKHAVGKADGRSEVSQSDMLADPDRNWRYMKMACGENAKRIYGKVGERGPFSRLGEAWQFRHAFEKATKLVEAQNDWCNAADKVGVESMDTYLPKDLQWESLGAALRGQVHINTHCYTVNDLESFVRHTNEWKFSIRAFHHAHETYIVPEVLKRAYGPRPPAAALFADQMYYKVEAYLGSEQAGKILYENGITPVYVSDNPVINAQHVVLEAARAYGYGLPYHVALSGVTSASAELLGLGERIGKVKAGFDADIVVWDSDPLSAGATPVQVWIDGAAQYKNPYVLKKSAGKSTELPPQAVATRSGTYSIERNAIFTGISKVMLGKDAQTIMDSTKDIKAVVQDGRITCVGTCEEEVAATTHHSLRTINVKNGYLMKPFTAMASSLGLAEINGERDTQDGDNGPENWSRALDGLALEGKQLAAATRHGILRAITAPSASDGGFRGVSVGFKTSATTALDKDAVFASEVAVHYPVTKSDKTPSKSGSLARLRSKLIKASTSNETAEAFSEGYYLKRVLAGDMALALNIDSADTTASAIRMKSEVEGLIRSKIRLVVIGGAESWMVAHELAAAGVAIVLAPYLSYAASWDQRRSLPGAPLSNGTALDYLLDAGVSVAIGNGDELSDTRNLPLMAGIAYKNGEGRLTEEAAMKLVGANIYKILGIQDPVGDDFVLFEGSPFEIGSVLRASSDGHGTLRLWS